jgi:hypothetical protein
LTITTFGAIVARSNLDVYAKIAEFPGVRADASPPDVPAYRERMERE